jgi:hypothetical protein
MIERRRGGPASMVAEVMYEKIVMVHHDVLGGWKDTVVNVLAGASGRAGEGR